MAKKPRTSSRTLRLPPVEHGLRKLLAVGPPVSEATRKVMLANRGRDTKPEMLVRRALHAAGLRYRLHDPKLPGRPDIVLPGRRTIIEVRGCFWHGHEGCRGAHTPKTRSEFWQKKIATNQRRDARNEALLKEDGWSVHILWECEAKEPERLNSLIREVRDQPPRSRIKGSASTQR